MKTVRTTNAPLNALAIVVAMLCAGATEGPGEITAAANPTDWCTVDGGSPGFSFTVPDSERDGTRPTDPCCSPTGENLGWDHAGYKGTWSGTHVKSDGYLDTSGINSHVDVTATVKDVKVVWWCVGNAEGDEMRDVGISGEDSATMKVKYNNTSVPTISKGNGETGLADKSVEDRQGERLGEALYYFYTGTFSQVVGTEVYSPASDPISFGCSLDADSNPPASPTIRAGFTLSLKGISVPFRFEDAGDSGFSRAGQKDKRWFVRWFERTIEGKSAHFRGTRQAKIRVVDEHNPNGYWEDYAAPESLDQDVSNTGHSETVSKVAVPCDTLPECCDASGS